MFGAVTSAPVSITAIVIEAAAWRAERGTTFRRVAVYCHSSVAVAAEVGAAPSFRRETVGRTQATPGRARSAAMSEVETTAMPSRSTRVATCSPRSAAGLVYRTATVRGCAQAGAPSTRARARAATG